MKNRFSLLQLSRCFLLFIALLASFSCSTDGGLQQLIGVKAEAPVFLDCKAVSPTEIVFSFSHSVEVSALAFEPPLETGSVEGGSEVKVSFAEGLKEGMKITADIVVEDADGNTLNVIVPFRARNERMPELLFNELRTEYSKPKVEFVELFALKAGNLGAMRLFIAGNSLSKPVYEFPPVEVKAGEYIVLHLRTLEEGCVDETGTDLALSSGTEAQPDARDFWLPGASKLFRKTDALWLMDQDDRILDAVLLSESAAGNWANDKIAEAAKFLGKEKAWLPAGGEAGEGWIPGPSDALISAGTTVTRTICRDENIPPEKRAGNWYITATSSATPGKPNNPKRYAP
jgi:hypothetical protein